MQAMSINAAEIPPITPGRVAAVATAELEASIALLGGLAAGATRNCRAWTPTTASRSTTSAATPGRSLSRCSPRSAPGRSAPAVGCPA